MAETDWTDRHVARWRAHWVDIRFDDEVEGIVTRIGRLQRHLKGTIQTAVAEVGIQDFEYETLHSLMIRDTPGTASPTDLADDLGVSGAGMTGRLDGLEKAGWVQRTASPDDRRRVVVEITRDGADVWRRAMALRGAQEEEMVAVLTAREQDQLNRLLKKLTLWTETPVTTFSVSTTSSATVDADRKRVWDALTDPDLLPRLTPYLRRIDARTDDAGWCAGPGTWSASRCSARWCRRRSPR